MDELVKINYGNQRPTVLGRDLHEALEVKTAYKDWFPKMCEYGFEEGSDFSSFLSESTGGRPSIDHQLTIDMAKELCMIQRTPKGKECRQYFLEIERRWNSPEAIMARALQIANQQLTQVRKQNKVLEGTVAVQNQQIAEMKPKVSYYDVVLNCKDLISTSAIAKDYGKSAIWMNRYLNKKASNLNKVASGFYIRSMQKKAIPAPRHIATLVVTVNCIQKSIHIGLKKADSSFTNC